MPQAGWDTVLPDGHFLVSDLRGREYMYVCLGHDLYTRVDRFSKSSSSAIGYVEHMGLSIGMSGLTKQVHLAVN